MKQVENNPRNCSYFLLYTMYTGTLKDTENQVKIRGCLCNTQGRTEHSTVPPTEMALSNHFPRTQPTSSLENNYSLLMKTFQEMK